MKTQSSAMDFFAHQDMARKNTRRFVLLYSGAVVAICVAVGILFALIAIMMNDSARADRTMLALVFGGTAAVLSALIIFGGSAYRIMDLRGGGSSVARGLGGILISPSTRDPDERRVLNVVEEMAIASGVPVPPVYMMPNERRINAFAAGYRPGDAVIGVTRGCVEGLTRDELQGVMAHEFSHILNGDMRLNIRMIGFLNGILIITIAGRILFEVAPRTGRSKEGAGAMLAMFVVAICLVVIGSVGALCARIIQSAVSRQREFLADASAVQFTRNPDGIADALRRIGGSAGGKIRHPRVEEASHMFFSQATKLSATLATHPPLKERIRRVLPSWDGTFLDPLIPSDRKEEKKPDPASRLGDRIEDALSQEGANVEALLPLLALSGMMTPKHIEHAQGIIASIPENLREAAHDPYSGRAVIYALLLDRKDAELRETQLRQLDSNGDPAIARLVRSLSKEAVGLRRELRLPLLDMTLGALAHLSDEQHVTFRRNVEVLVKMDKSIDLFEWMTMNTLKRHLDERFGLAKPVPVQYYNLNKLGHEVSVLLSMLAHTGSKDEYGAGEAVLMGESAVQGIGVRLLPKDEANMRALDTALKTLNECTARVKKQLLQAAALVVGADHEITTNEAELLRAVADSLGVPTPPLLPGQKLV
ncbi:MAG: M48 family metallopeptidase [Phycisphaerales bacterium]|nr:M48 family metallopeptidase [Phycisphaerales bacterium]